MDYPTLEQVEGAGRLQLAAWVRRLPSPGARCLGLEMSWADFDAKMAEEKVMLDRIVSRFEQRGGWTPALSKAVEHG